ncbi:MAG TPA: ABC transporter permease [Longimicrobiaceae bacterium]|nr:ABC transporter permease [Longimicrobiaceae bacterium]
MDGPIWRRYVRFLGSDPAADVDDELSFHIAMRVDDLTRNGLSEPAAHERARREFGDPDQVRSELEAIGYRRLRKVNRARRWESIGQDLTFSVRWLLKSRGFTLVAVLTLALGIGANSAIFSVVNSVLLRPLDYRDPEELVFLHSEFRGLGFDKFGISAPEYREIQQNMRSLIQVGAWSTGSVSLSSIESPVRVTTAFAGAEVFATLGVAPQIGRTYTLEEDLADVNLGVISHRLWQSAFGGDPGVIGQSVELNGVQVPVIGVMPEGFDLGEAGIDLWITLGIALNPTASRTDHFLNLVGRMAPGATLEQAQREMRVLLGRWDELAPGDHVPTATDHPMHIKSLRDEVVGDVRPALLLLLGAVGFVLLIACANVANLLLARAEGRQKEIAVRTALGAGRGRIIRQFLTESILLALVGGVFGLILGYVGLRALVAMSAESIPRIGAVDLDPRVLLFTLAISLLTGALFGIAPLLHSQRGMASALREGSQRTTAAAGRQRLRGALIIAEVALAVVLLVGSGLLLRSFAALQEVDLGFDPDGLLTFGIYLPFGNYPEPADVTSFHRRLIERLEAMPGTTGTALMSGLPPMQNANATDTDFEGK